MQTGKARLPQHLPTLTLLFVCVLWTYWTTLTVLVHAWSTSPQYSHGFLVPLIAVWIVWSRSRGSVPVRWRPNWWGLSSLELGTAMRLFGAYYYFEWVDGLSLLPLLAGVCLMLTGIPGLKVCWPGIAFLAFMFPLPYRLDVALAGPLQSFATSSSTFALQTLGLPAIAEGNTILLRDVRIGVAEACSGLRMLVVFAAICTAAAIVTRRTMAERVVLVASAVPIALLCNCTRIVLTGIAHAAFGRALADLVFHDLAGWMMMPLALLFVWGELWIFSRLFVEPPARDVVPVLPTRSLTRQPTTMLSGAPVVTACLSTTAQPGLSDARRSLPRCGDSERGTGHSLKQNVSQPTQSLDPDADDVSHSVLAEIEAIESNVASIAVARTSVTSHSGTASAT